MRGSAAELASAISRALLTASTPTRAWTPSLEQTLHRLSCRDSLSPTLVARVIDPFLLHHHALALGFFNWASQQPGFSHTPATYQSVLKSLSSSRQYTSIESLLKQLRAQKISLPPSGCRSVIGSLVAGRRTRTAFLVFSEVGYAVAEIGGEVCNSLLAALSSEGSLKSAHKVFDEMIQRGVMLNTLGFGVFLWRACGKKDINEIFGLIDDVRRVNYSGINGSVFALLVVHGLCAEKRVMDAVFALEELRRRECKPDFMAYRTVAEAMREMGYVAEVEMVLKRKRKLGVAPRAYDYRELILQFVSERLIFEAKELGEVIVSGNFPIEDDVLNVLIGSVSASNPSAAVSFLKFMLEKNKFPTLLTLTNLSENLCKHEKGEELVEIFQLLSMKEYFKTSEGYNMMISFLCKGGRVREGYEVVQEMKKKGLSPDVWSYNCLLEACCRENLIRPAKRLWDEMFASGCCGNLDSYNILIRKFCELGEAEDAHRLFQQMIEKGLEADESTCKALLRGLCEAKNVDMALGVFNKAVEQDVKLANSLLSGFVQFLCKEGFLLPACKLARESTCSGIEPHLSLLRYLGNIGELSLASQHLEWVAEQSPALLHAIQPQLPPLLEIQHQSH